MRHTSTSRLLPAFWRLLYWTMAVAGLAYVFWSLLNFGKPVGADLHAYWNLDLAHLYDGPVVGQPDAYLYSPAFALVMVPFGWIPFPVFYLLWLTASIAALLWLRAGWLIMFSPFWTELIYGNVNILYALVLVVGFRWSGVWALPLLTKITPGVGVLWFALRGEWKLFWFAVGVTLSIAGICFVFRPCEWVLWADVLRGNDASGIAPWPPVELRLPLAILLVALAARTNQRWLIPVAVLLAMPVIWVASFTVLAAIPRLWRQPDVKTELQTPRAPAGAT
jgi:hypothetical protein